jgi:hypothetical protein
MYRKPHLPLTKRGPTAPPLWRSRVWRSRETGLPSWGSMAAGGGHSGRVVRVASGGLRKNGSLAQAADRIERRCCPGGGGPRDSRTAGQQVPSRRSGAGSPQELEREQSRRKMAWPDSGTTVAHLTKGQASGSRADPGASLPREAMARTRPAESRASIGAVARAVPANRGWTRGKPAAPPPRTADIAHPVRRAL